MHTVKSWNGHASEVYLSQIESLKENKLPLIAMVERNLKGRYGNSVIGAAWNILLPVLLTFVIWLVFTQIKNFHADADFWLYLATGMFAMTPLMNSVRGRIFYNNSSYVKKTSVPNQIAVLADALTQFLLFVIQYALLIIAVVVSGIHINPYALLFLPVAFLLLFLMCLGCSFLFSTLNVVQNDVGHIMTVVARVAIWITPVFFFLNDTGPTLRLVATYNPFTYFIEILHQVIYNAALPEMSVVAMAVIFAAAFLQLGLAVFKYFDMELAERL